MSFYAKRSAMTELIDKPGIPFNDWEICLKELNTINTFLGGHNITIEGVRELLSKEKKSFNITEIGCGGGDNLKAIYKWNRRKKYPLSYTGVDLNAACIDFARVHCSELPGAQFIHSDYRSVVFKDKPDIIFNSLFCHHFNNDQLVEMLTWLKQNAIKGFFINDLQRHPVAYHSIKILTKLFSRSYLVRNDAPISVMRGFRRSEWEILLQRAGIKKYCIKWKWAFRYLIVVNNE